METEPPSLPATPRGGRSTWRVLRPLFWWLLLVLVLFAIRTHQRLMEQTRIQFSVVMEGPSSARESAEGASTTLDGQPVFSGQRLSLGSHQFAVTHPKGEPFSTNLFTWYGGHDLGTIGLKRATGTLAIQVKPTAARLRVLGPELASALTNSEGGTYAVPTGRYKVEAQFAHLEQTAQTDVSMNSTSTVHIAPAMGALRITSSHSNTTYRLARTSPRVSVQGEVPAVIAELPEGTYELTTERSGDQQTKPVSVAVGQTNEYRAIFGYGALRLESTPPGATVLDAKGEGKGTTPLVLSELKSGVWKGALWLDGYVTVALQATVTPGETNFIQTNLVSARYADALADAQQSMARGNFTRAMEAAAAALQASPEDPAASALRREAAAHHHLQRAKTWRKNEDYNNARAEALEVLKNAPENEEAKALVAEYWTQRQGILKMAFDAALKGETQVGEEALFEQQEITTGVPYAKVEAAVWEALKDGTPGFKVTRKGLQWPLTFAIFGLQEFAGGARRCAVVGVQTQENETKIVLKVMEYRTTTGMDLGLMRAFVPLHESYGGALNDKRKAQIEEGKRTVGERIRKALAEVPESD